MKQVKIKNIILIAMVLVCIYLSSNVWLKLPSFLKYEDNTDVNNDEIVVADIWNIVRPIKNVIKYNENYTITYNDELDLWGKTVHIINDALDSFENSNINESAAFPAQYLKFDFNTNIPVDIFTGHMKINNLEIKNVIKNVKNVIIDLENANSIYIYNGENTVRIENENINTNQLASAAKNMDFDKETQYIFDQKIGGETIQVPIPLEKSALNPVFVQSEIDVFDTETINKIAKNYFRNKYDHVRKSVEVSGNLVYIYRTEKILKVNSEGLLDFYDTSTELENNTDLYKSLLKAISFTEEFLGLPDDGYLSNVESIQYDGNYGYRYIFSYKILERPILFSKVRENTALQIDVVGTDVVSYKRFIRNVDETQMGMENEIQVIPAIDVIIKNLDEEDKENKEETQENLISELKPLKKSMIKDISNIYLGYFDLSRISREQLLRAVWVIEVNDKSFIFNAITGALIEEW